MICNHRYFQKICWIQDIVHLKNRIGFVLNPIEDDLEDVQEQLFAERSDRMKLPHGATKDDFESCKKIVSTLLDDKSNLDEITLKIMNISYSTSGNYSEEMMLKYITLYLELNK